MKLWTDSIQDLLAIRAYMKTAVCPITQPVVEGEKVLGTLPPELRPLWDLVHKLTSEQATAEQALRDWCDAHPCFDPDDPANAGERTMIAEHQRLRNTVLISCLHNESVGLLLTTEIAKLTLPDHWSSVEIRTDWQMVAFEDEHEIHIFMIDPIGDLLGRTQR